MAQTDINPQILKQYLANLAYLRNSIIQDTNLTDEEKQTKLTLLNSENDEMLQTFDLYKVILELETSLTYDEIVAKINTLDSDIHTKLQQFEDDKTNLFSNLQTQLNEKVEQYNQQITSLKNEKTQKFQQLDEDITTFKQSKTQEFDTQKQTLFNQIQSSINNFKSQIWDDVGGALGQFSKKVYVSNSGDDNSSGTNAEPFLTIEKACKSIPIGGVGFIYLKSGETFTPMEDLEIEGKQIIFLKNGADRAKIKIHTFLDSNDRISAFLFGNFLKLGNYAAAFKSVDIEEEDNNFDDKELNYSKNAFFPTVYDGYIKNRFIYFVSSNIKTKYLDVVASPVSTYGYSWSIGGGNTLLKARSCEFILGHNLLDCTESFVDFIGKHNTFKDRDGNDKTLDEVVVGISVDSNSNPINFRKLEL